MRPSIRQRLSRLWTHIQYYRYEPSKPSRSEFLRLTLNDQASWIENNNAEENTIDDGCFFYRDSTDQNDHHIALFEFPNSDVDVSDVGSMDRDPISSDCQAVWTSDNELVFFDGTDMSW